MAPTYYSILNIATSATQRDIKVAYRKLVQQHHPDVNTSGNDELIKQINVAYETLSDPNKKAIYDRSLLRSFSQPVSTTSYNQPTYTSQPRRRPPPHSYQNRTSGTTYTYSTKTKLQGWAAVFIAILAIYGAIRGLDYYAAEQYFEEATIAEANKDYNNAFRLYQLAIRDWGSKNVAATMRMIELNKKMSAYHAMVDNAEVAFTYNPDSVNAARLYFLKAQGYAQTDRYQEAVWAYLNSLDYHFNKDSVYAQLGPIYLGQLQQYNEATKIYSYLLQDDINNLEDYFNRATCYQLQGKHQLAIDDLLIVLKDDPYNEKILFQLGRSYLALGQKEIACKYFRFAKKQGVNIDPTELSQTCD